MFRNCFSRAGLLPPEYDLCHFTYTEDTNLTTCAYSVHKD